MSSSPYLANITQNASRLGERIQESISEHTRDLGLNRGGSSLLDATDDKSKNISKQLESTSDREKLDAMKRLVALISKGRHVSEYFAPVVKNVGSHNLEIRKLVYIYLLKYAEQEPDLALLSINTFQKDLNDSNPLIRAMALRVLSGIKVPTIGSIVVLAIKKCAGDPSPYVRKAAALAIPKCYELDSTHLPELISIISNMLRDRSPLSIGNVVVAFEAVCPTRLDLLHREYRRLCRMLADIDEWGQIDVLNLLLRYSRTMLARPPHDGLEQDLDPDLRLLLTSAETLLQSRNSAVVVAVVRVVHYLGLSSHQQKIVNPLLRLLSASPEVGRIALTYISFISQHRADLFAPFYSKFILRSNDLRVVKHEKIRLLLSILDQDNHQAILREFIDYVDDPDDTVIAESIRAIGRCAARIPDCTSQCLNALTTMIKSRHDIVVSNAVLVLKHLVQVQLSVSASAPPSGKSPLSIVSHLARKFDDIRHAEARACVIWLVGQYASSDPSKSSVPGLEGLAEWAPDVLRKATKGFISEPSLVKLQIVTLASKLLVLAPSHDQLVLLCKYVFQLARYDVDYDVRDRARLLFSLLSGCSLHPVISEVDREDRGGVVLRREQVKLVLFEGKRGVVAEEAHTADPNTTLGSLGLITGKPAQMDQVPIPDWLEHAVDSSFRDNPEDEARQERANAPTAISSQQIQQQGKNSPVVLTPRTSSPANVSAGPSKSAYADLDAFYAENEEDEEESEEEDSEEGDEDSEEEESEEDEEEEDTEGSEDDGREDTENRTYT